MTSSENTESRLLRPDTVVGSPEHLAIVNEITREALALIRLASQPYRHCTTGNGVSASRPVPVFLHDGPEQFRGQRWIDTPWNIDYPEKVIVHTKDTETGLLRAGEYIPAAWNPAFLLWNGWTW